MSDVKETAERISTERLEELIAFFAPRPEGLPWRASMDAETVLRSALASRHADAQEGGEVERAIDLSPAEGEAWEFDRYINGVLMAEGVSVKHAATLEQAFCKAAAMASKGRNGQVPVLALRTKSHAAPSNPVAWLHDPTDAMIEAGLRVDLDNEDERATIINVWHAMSAAAPAQPVADDLGGYWSDDKTYEEAPAPSNPVVSDEMVLAAYAVIYPYAKHITSERENVIRAALTAALSVNPQIGSE